MIQWRTTYHKFYLEVDMIKADDILKNRVHYKDYKPSSPHVVMWTVSLPLRPHKILLITAKVSWQKYYIVRLHFTLLPSRKDEEVVMRMWSSLTTSSVRALEAPYGFPSRWSELLQYMIADVSEPSLIHSLTLCLFGNIFCFCSGYRITISWRPDFFGPRKDWIDSENDSDRSNLQMKYLQVSLVIDIWIKICLSGISW